MLPQKAEINGARNGTFLTLNIGNNTFQFGSSSTFPESSRDLIVPATNTSSTSTEEGSAGSQSYKRASKQRDPDWMPDDNRVRKSVRQPSASSNSPEISGPLVISRNPSEVSLRPLVICSNPSEVSHGNASNAPPDYLVTLLGYSNWKVEFWPSSGTYVYVSPTGQPYCSPIKAYEAFLQGMSSTRGKAPAPFQPLGCSWDGSGVSGLQRKTVKKGRGPAKRRRSPICPIQEPVVIDVESSQEANPVASSCKKKEKTTIVEGSGLNQMKNNDVGISSYGNVAPIGIDKSRMRLSAKWIGTRRRRCRRHLGSMQSGSKVGKPLDPAFVLDEEKHEPTKLGSMNNHHAGDHAVGVRRSGRKKGKHVVVDDGPDAQLESGIGYLPLFGLAPSITPVPVDAQLNQANMNAMKPPAATQKPRRNGGCGLAIRRERKNDHQEETVSAPTKICMLTWLIGYGILTEREMITYITKNSTNKVCRGLVTQGSIRCECCDVVMPLLNFQAHVIGDTTVNRPWADMYLQSGKTLVDCLSEAWEKVKGEKSIGFQMVGTEGPDPSDDTCGVCADGGHLICCDGCPSTFHQDCVSLKALPEGSWYCQYCRCSFCMVGDHGSGSGHETFPFLKCKQCGCKYHRNCSWKRGMHDLWEETYSFCGKNCKKIADQLSGILGIPHPIEGGFSWSLLHRLNEDEGDGSGGNFSFIMECNAKLSMAFTVLDECFATLKDRRTGLDMICQAVYNCGSNFNRLNYEGFYTLVLEKDEEIVSAATLRFHGRKLAEMPFIGTRPMFRMQGMCRRLLKAIEDMLSCLLVEKLIIPAIPDLLETWRTSFSFKFLESSHKEEIRNLSMVIFPFTTLLHKSICNNDTTGPEGNVASSTASSICFHANSMPADNSAEQQTQREETDEIPQSYNVDTCSGVNFARGIDWCGQRKDATINPCKMTSNSIFSPGLLNPSCSFMEKKDDIPESYEGPSFLSPSCSFMEQKNATPESYKKIKESSSFRNSLNARLPKVPRESTLEISAINNTYIPSLNSSPRNHMMTAFSSPSVNVDRNNDSQSVRTPALTSGHRNTWLRNRGGRKDIHNAAMRRSLAFDSLLGSEAKYPVPP